MNVRVNGQAVFNTPPHIALAALDGLGIAFLPEEEFATHIENSAWSRAAGLDAHPSPAITFTSRRQHYRRSRSAWMHCGRDWSWVSDKQARPLSFCDSAGVHLLHNSLMALGAVAVIRPSR
jgi:hypothetical protein